MSNLRIIAENQLHGFRLTAYPEGVETLPVENILDDERSYVFRSQTIDSSAGDFTQVIRGENINGLRKAANGLAIVRHNLNGSADSYQLILSRKGEITFDSGEVGVASFIPLGIWQAGVNYFGETFGSDQLDPVSVIWFPKSFYDTVELRLTKRYFDSPYTDYMPYIDVGHVFIGLSISPTKNFRWGNNLLQDDGSKLVSTQGRSLVTEGGGELRRKMSLNLHRLTDKDRDSFSVALRKSSGKSILVAGYPNASRVREVEHTMIAKEAMPRGEWSHLGPNRHQYPLTLLEI